MQRIALAGVLPVLLAVPSIAGAGVEAPPGGGASPIISEAEFLSVLDDAHPAVVEKMADLAVARARVVAASTLENPALGTVREDPSGPATQTEWTLSWQLPGADRRPMISAREETVAAEGARLSHRLLALRLAMQATYADWAVATSRHERLAARAERVGALAERERLRAQRGETSGLEARRLELAASGLRARVALVAGAAERARVTAAGWHPALPPDARPVLPPLPAAPELTPDHPRIRAAEKDLAAATLEREAAGRFVRSPEISLGWQRQEAEGSSASGPILGVAWSVPIWARNRAEKATADARISAARARLASVRREIESARAGAQASFQSLARSLAAAEQDLDGNERMLDGAEAAFRHGETSLTDLLEIHRSVTESELVVIDLHEAALAAHRDLERAAGADHQVTPSETKTQESLP